jgi:hypothetical protein
MSTSRGEAVGLPTSLRTGVGSLSSTIAAGFRAPESRWPPVLTLAPARVSWSNFLRVVITRKPSRGRPTVNGSRCWERRVARPRAPGGVVRPDGSDARRVAGVRSGTAAFGPWLRSGAVLPLSVSGRRPEATSSTLLDVNTGVSRPLGYGAVFTVMDLRHDAGAALVRIGPRGQRTLVVVDLESGTTTELVPAGDGMTDQGFFMPDGSVLARSNFGREDYVLVELEAGRPPRVLATHPGGELDTFAVTADGARAALVWNVGGRSALELMELGSGERLRVGGPDVIDRVGFSADGSRLVVAGQGSRQPRALWQVELNPLTTRLVPVPTPGPALVERRRLVTPTREVSRGQAALRDGGGGVSRPPPAPRLRAGASGPVGPELVGLTPTYSAFLDGAYR